MFKYDAELELEQVRKKIENLENELYDLKKEKTVRNYCDREILLEYFNKIKYDDTKNTNDILLVDIMNEIDILLLDDDVQKYIRLSYDLNLCKNVERILLKSKKTLKKGK